MNIYTKDAITQAWLDVQEADGVAHEREEHFLALGGATIRALKQRGENAAEMTAYNAYRDGDWSAGWNRRGEVVETWTSLLLQHLSDYNRLHRGCTHHFMRPNCGKEAFFGGGDEREVAHYLAELADRVYPALPSRLEKFVNANNRLYPCPVAELENELAAIVREKRSTPVYIQDDKNGGLLIYHAFYTSDGDYFLDKDYLVVIKPADKGASVSARGETLITALSYAQEKLARALTATP